MSWWSVLACLLLAACQTPPPRPAGVEPVRRSQPALGTFVTITAYGSDSSNVASAVTAAFGEFERIDAMMSVHRKDSEVAGLNAEAPRAPFRASPELYRLIAKAQEISRETGGSFDITVRPLTELWGFLWKEYRMPERSELNGILPRVNYRHLHLDPKFQTVRFARPGVSVDLNGIAKGYAVDCAISQLRAWGVTNAMVKAGGDLRVIGAPPGEPFWTVQLEDPEKKRRRISIPLRDAALSTSGDYENYFEVKGRRYSHILDPRTGLPVEGIAACTVIAPTCMESDAWATACMAFGVENSLKKFSHWLPMRFTLRGGDRLAVRQTKSFPAALR